MASRVGKRTQAQPLKPKHKTAAPVTRPVKETVNSRAIISTSKILKRQPMKVVYGKKHIKYARREPEHDLFLDFKGMSLSSSSCSSTLFPLSRCKDTDKGL